jgi:hypothetical protein
MPSYTHWYELCTKFYYKSVYTLICRHVHTGTSQYISVWTRTCWYKTVYMHMKSVYQDTSPYIRVWIILQKHAWSRDSKHGSHGHCKAVHSTSYHCATSVGMAKLHYMRIGDALARHLLAGVGRPVRSRDLTRFWSGSHKKIRPDLLVYE